ncbi:HpcH/HpaI aldolase family protein [Halorubrum vacuolatum]|uniref:2-dehydro-3-deoxyglucarate aldolase n=1 Tax=Halorubrum vacuolatum TaxID=63740 RepID=A0A238XGU3_HALVU|nr:aldolase/citrate lyase family protein [Halorubrum vacuolatum]SNR57922.1 2-dehydro-3-deoxyglucarate aldolase [Halorubrum vacuolatum]
MDQSNTLRKTIENDGVVYGARSSTFSPTVIEVFGDLGVDFVWLDFEHMGPSPYDSRVFEDLTRAAEAGGTELFVRLPSGDPPLIRKVLDAGVRNLLIPRVDSAAEVQEAVEATRFIYNGQPGERGKASGRSSNWGHADAYVETEDKEVCLGVMIEKTTAVEELQEILSVPELGFVFIGPSDLSVQMGHPTDKTHSTVTDQIVEIEEACVDAGVPLGGIRNSVDEISEAERNGYQILRIGGDLNSIVSTLGTRLESIREGN